MNERKWMNVPWERAAGGMLFMAAMSFAGSAVVATKWFLTGAPVFFTTFCTLLVALVGILPLQWRRRQELRLLSRAELVSITLQGLCGIVLFRIFTMYGLRHTGATQAGIITGTTPATIAFLSMLFLRERPGRKTLGGIALAVLGVIIINLMSGTGRAGGGNLLGSLLIMAAVLSESLLTIFRKAVAGRVSSVTNTTVIISVCTILTLPLAILDLAGSAYLPDGQFLIGILWYGLGATVVGYLCFMAGSARISAAAAGVLSAMLPVSAVTLSALFLGEPFGPAQLAGALLVVAAIVMTAMDR